MRLSAPDDRDDIADAVSAVCNGEAVGVHFGTVFGIVVDGDLSEVADEVEAVKGTHRGHRPLAACLTSDRIAETVDATALAPEAAALLAARWFREDVAGFTAVRAPLDSRVGVPAALQSHVDGTSWVQTVNARRLPGAARLIAALWDAGVRWVAATSMNESGRPEIVDLEAARDFSRRHHLAALFPPVTAHAATGSLPILELRPDGIRLDREGIVALADLERAVGGPIPAADAIPAHFPSLEVDPEDLRDLSPPEVSAALLRLLYPDL
jgi:tRNA A37 threonylcarbamoyladenosine synthetase subunit TsaC/SUA5/YrdC